VGEPKAKNYRGKYSKGGNMGIRVIVVIARQTGSAGLENKEQVN
jgi:hypothetical protein